MLWQPVMQAHPEISGWAMLAGWVLFTDHALKWSRGHDKAGCHCFSSHHAAVIREGYTDMLLAQQVYEWRVRPVDLLFDAVENGKFPESWFVKISLLPVTKENVEDLSKRWTGWLQGQSN